jgi:integrase
VPIAVIREPTVWFSSTSPSRCHASLLLKSRVPVKVVSERLGHATPAFTMTVYQHVLPGMQAEAATTFANLVFGPDVVI